MWISQAPPFTVRTPTPSDALPRRWRSQHGPTPLSGANRACTNHAGTILHALAACEVLHDAPLRRRACDSLSGRKASADSTDVKIEAFDVEKYLPERSRRMSHTDGRPGAPLRTA